MNNEISVCTVTWLIENYSHCWHKHGESIGSPLFTAAALEGTVWRITLYPRGYSEIGYISLYLQRNAIDDGPEEFPINYNLSILTEDGSTPKRDNCQLAFKKFRAHGFHKFQKMEEILYCTKSINLTHDTLTVQCKIWRNEVQIDLVKQITARTRIGIKQISFPLPIEGFSTIEPDQKKTVDIKSSSKWGLGLSCNMHLTDDSWCDGTIIVEIIPTETNHILSRCAVSLLDEYGKLIPCGEADNRFDAVRKDIRKLPLTLTRRDIMQRKNEYLPNDKLTLLCECIFSTGIEYESFENTLHEIPIVALNQIKSNDRNKGFYDAAKKLSACPSGLDDFKEIYNTQFLADVEMRTKTKSFPTHKLVLCARSSVFRAMLTNDMKEKYTDSIQVDDLEEDIVHQLLLFLYTDKLENLQWESAIKLYYVGDKYAIEKLKVMCASFLVDNLSASSASELLLLADTHNDADLKLAIEDFIFKHEKQVFGSVEWQNLIETNPVLVSKTMCLKYMRDM